MEAIPSKKKKLKKPPNPKVRAWVWKVANVFVALTPLLVLGVINWKYYFAMNTTSTFSNVVGVVSLSIFMGAIVSKRTNFLRGLWGFLLLSLILECLHAIIQDIRLISWAATLGMGVSHFWTAPKYLKWEKIIERSEEADINATAMEKAIEKAIEKVIVRSGRV